MKLLEQKKAMAFEGYYSISDFAKMKGLSRQAWFKKIQANQIEYHERFGRYWIKYDNGENAIKLYPEIEKPTLDILKDYGFLERTKSFSISVNTLIDIKLLNDKGDIAISFYKGDYSQKSIAFFANINQFEILN